ncbi:hypothetical protein [Streptococcus pneumoniae]|uniref:hypothetical protein n=1 Tax=Streptococcus pneumoniae TaxID=1313 RepID=UPI0012FE9633|nr:hypothetical protein [Streptococcus pneumoniae]
MAHPLSAYLAAPVWLLKGLCGASVALSPYLPPLAPKASAQAQPTAADGAMQPS